MSAYKKRWVSGIKDKNPYFIRVFHIHEKNAKFNFSVIIAKSVMR